MSLALSSVGWFLLSGGSAEAHGWLVERSQAFVIRFSVEMRVTKRPDLFIPAHRTGFIRVDGDEFNVSTAWLLSTSYVAYERVRLVKIDSPAAASQEVVDSTFERAFWQALDTQVCPGFSQLKDRLADPPARGGRLRWSVDGTEFEATYDRTLAALKGLVRRERDGRETRCQFEIVQIPSDVVPQP